MQQPACDGDPVTMYYDEFFLVPEPGVYAILLSGVVWGVALWNRRRESSFIGGNTR